MWLGTGDDFRIRGEGGDEGASFIGIEIAGDDDVCFVRRVAVAVVIGEIGVGDFIEKMAVPNDRMAACIYCECSGEQETDGGIIGIVEAHIDLAADDIFFTLKLRLRDEREEHQPGEAFQESLQRMRRAIDVIDGAIKGGVGIPVAAACLHGLGEAFGSVVASAFKDHVL